MRDRASGGGRPGLQLGGSVLWGRRWGLLDFGEPHWGLIDCRRSGHRVTALVRARDGMGRHKRTDPSQGNTMEQYTIPVPLPQNPARSEWSRDAMRVPLDPEEASHAELLAAIQGSRVALEVKLETVAVEVNLLRADLLKVSDNVKVAEGSIVELQTGRGSAATNGTGQFHGRTA
ncbi:hypothetical protein NDU88_007050 [Pleurodeles waltl]|uniref:Uncharacterized protein n=1 Tax=Pleurodeles waltl TaxID=8319 RepID=A0AAV7QQQ7_PLEWA|nr:hypothetical protein NDU88_007050 [Pleurodeles waltl]